MSTEAMDISQFTLARYNDDGHLDRTFGINGKVLTSFSSATEERAGALALDGWGRIVAAGSVEVNWRSQFALARYTDDGTLDASFHGDGKVLTDFSSATEERAHALTLDGWGRIVAAGYAVVGGRSQFALARYKDDGSLDASFHGDGRVLTDFSSAEHEAAHTVAIDPLGRIVAAGYAVVGGRSQFALARYKDDGTLDASFHGDGKVLTDFSSATEERAHALTLDGWGRIVAAGYAVVGGRSQFALARYKDDGSLDASFHGDGRVLTDFSSAEHEAAHTVAIDPLGRIVAAGSATVEGRTQFALARYTNDGSLDSSFGTGGMVLTKFSSSWDERIFASLIDPFGKVVVAGFAWTEGGGQIGLARYHDDGRLDPSFGTDGKILTDFFAHPSEWANGIAIDPMGRLVAAGNTSSSPAPR